MVSSIILSLIADVATSFEHFSRSSLFSSRSSGVKSLSKSFNASSNLLEFFDLTASSKFLRVDSNLFSNAIINLKIQIQTERY